MLRLTRGELERRGSNPYTRVIALLVWTASRLAREPGVGITAVASLMASGFLPTIDFGLADFAVLNQGRGPTLGVGANRKVKAGPQPV